jgi:hypothetical protein
MSLPIGNSPAFDAFAARKTREAGSAFIASLSTILDSPDVPSRRVGNAWTRTHYGGDFDLETISRPACRPRSSIVMSMATPARSISFRSLRRSASRRVITQTLSFRPRSSGASADPAADSGLVFARDRAGGCDETIGNSVRSVVDGDRGVRGAFEG